MEKMTDDAELDAISARPWSSPEYDHALTSFRTLAFTGTLDESALDWLNNNRDMAHALEWELGQLQEEPVAVIDRDMFERRLRAGLALVGCARQLIQVERRYDGVLGVISRRSMPSHVEVNEQFYGPGVAALINTTTRRRAVVPTKVVNS